MKKYPENQQSTFFYDENGTKEVSEQIMDAYNSGFINQYSTESVEPNTLDSLF
ncbi:hypothetical protein HHO41_10635 [Bacillus sp. DNRA2]|uniref:hypothetical protein n=1 Tax=Bacillus sp. DNRA2 TaxID=2723053 RepID=UPI00145DA090|nr:hypothetical protein [Bacillus sp. DNRA2]NMD70749.1 hypothetical protein [Bacillus sp. DNRA2]